MSKQRPRPPATPRQAGARPAPLDGLLDADFFKALGDPTRARILSCLCRCSRPCAVSEIGECCSVDLSVVSRHLAVLERAGVLDSTKRGRVVLYRVRYDALVRAFQGLAGAIDSCRRACAGVEGCEGGACCTAPDCAPATPAAGARHAR